MQIEDRLLDIIRSPAVMVDDRDAGNGLEQRAALDLLRPVGVDDDEQAPVVRLDQRILSGDEQILVAGAALSSVIRLWQAFFCRSITIRAGRSFTRHRHRRPTAEPSASRSAIRCPMI